MCGIFGFLTSKPSEDNYDIFCRLANMSQTRGTDATGIAYFDTDKNKHCIDKHCINANDFQKRVLDDRRDVISKAPVAIGHTRAWTTGAPSDNNNNHPIYSDDWIMIHNGTCLATDDIKGYEYKGDVDSERILARIQKHGWKGFEECTGTAALAFLKVKDKDQRDAIYLYRDGNPMWLAYKEGDSTIWFASTKGILMDSLPSVLGFFSKYMFRELPEEEVYMLRVDGDKPYVDYIGYYEYNRWVSSYTVYGTGRSSYTPTPTGGNTIASPPTSNKLESQKLIETPSYTLVSYYNLTTKQDEKYDINDWTWDRDAGCWTHNEERLVKMYMGSEHRCVIASPETALEEGWFECLPLVYEREDKNAAGSKEEEEERKFPVVVASANFAGGK